MTSQPPTKARSPLELWRSLRIPTSQTRKATYQAWEMLLDGNPEIPREFPTRNHSAWDGGCKPLVNYMGFQLDTYPPKTGELSLLDFFFVARKSSMRNWTPLKSNELNTPRWVYSHGFFLFFFEAGEIPIFHDSVIFWGVWQPFVFHGWKWFTIFQEVNLGSFQMISM